MPRDMLEQGAGENQNFYSADIISQVQDYRHGTTANPVTTPGPTFKVSRTQSVTQAAIEAVGGVGTDGGEQLASILGINVGVSTDEVQPVGVYGGAKTSSTVGNPGNDACGGYFVGRITGSGTGVGIGAFVAARRENDTGSANGIEIHCANYGTVQPALSTTGFSKATGIWLNCSGNADSTVGFTFANAFGRQFEYGLYFNAQVNNGKTGGVRTTSIRDDSTSTNSIQIKGTHTMAMTVAAGGGKVILGGEAEQQAGALLEVQAPNVATNPVAQFGNSANAQGYGVRLRNSFAAASWWLSGGPGNFVTGTVAGDTGFALTTGMKFMVGLSAGTNIIAAHNNSSTPQLGFFGTTTAAKQTVTGSRADGSALASLLTALANYGFVTDSSTA